MTQMNDNKPSFNLWTEPWILLENKIGELSYHSIQDTLIHAHEYTAIFDKSPLVIVGIHRLLTAILQDALKPQENAELESLWKDGYFPPAKIHEFGQQYANRFDLFSKDKPFLQSADLPLFPDEKEHKTSNLKPAAFLFPEIPTGKSLVTHYRHTIQDEQVFTPAAVAAGLVTIPPFVSSGGRTLMPSINGVPPIYVLPSGKTLFECLAASLLSARWLDKYTVEYDLAWWKRDDPVIVHESKKKKPGMKFTEHRQLGEVGYLHGLTFPARKVRLHPQYTNEYCSRTGRQSEWCVRTMAFRMGESCLEDVVWLDPFVAYRLTSSSKRKSKSSERIERSDKPKPIRPKRGQAAWREFTGLFLQRSDDQHKFIRPAFLNQLAELEVSRRIQTYPFRCIAWQTDGKMKFYEWMDFGFDIPPSLLQDPNGAEWTDLALAFADQCALITKSVFVKKFSKKTKNTERFRRLKERMEQDYWSVLASKFRQYVLDLGDRTRQNEVLNDWYDTTVREAQSTFDNAANATGDDGHAMLLIEQGIEQCRKELNFLRSKTKQGG